MGEMHVNRMYIQSRRGGVCILPLQEMWRIMTITGLTVYVNPIVRLLPIVSIVLPPGLTDYAPNSPTVVIAETLKFLLYLP